jgi:FKBP-type peptidyl-prolyl cis-trans isomerase FkpA
MKSGSRTVVALLGMTLVGTIGCSRPGAAPAPKTEEHKTLYTIGQMMGRSLGVFNLSPEDLAQVKTGLDDAVNRRKSPVDMDAYGNKIQTLAQSRRPASIAAEKARAKPFIDAALREPGTVKLPSGTIMRTTRPGTGAIPTANDQVKVHYHGTLTDGTVFDSSIKRKEPATFGVGGVIKCWTESLERMKVGEKATLTCPAEVAYGDEGRQPTIPGGATLIFDVELLEIVKK